MKILQQENHLISSLIADDIITKNYKFSQFNLLKVIDGNYVLFNTLTRQLVLLNDSEYNYCKKDVFSYDKDNSFFMFLKDKNFIVRDEIDELKRYKQMLSIYRNFTQRAYSGIGQYKIFTTTFCNARCFYCFEEGMTQTNMTIETAERVVKYILKTSREGEIILYWFGGEPLCNASVIDYICNRLKEENKPYVSKMITNGYLFDEDLVKKARDLWNLQFVQITLDGTEQEHNRRKAYVKPSESPFKRTLRNMELLLNAEVKVICRLNFDENNFEDIDTLLDMLAVKFKDYKNFRAYPAILSVDWLNHRSSRTDEISDFLHRKYLYLRKKSFDYGYSKPAPLSKNPKPYFCMAANPRCATISADGELYTCQSCDDSMCYGDVVKGIQKPDIINQWQNCLDTLKKCDTCTFLPECSTFDKCPDDKTFCSLDIEASLKGKINDLISNCNQSDSDEELFW